MSNKLLRWVSIGTGVCLLLVLVGSIAFAAKKELTPLEWSYLKWQDKLKYKTVVIRDFMWTRDWTEEENLPTDATSVREKIHTGDLDTPYDWENLALFETKYPKVYIKPCVDIGMSSREAIQNFTAAMAAGNAPSIYAAADPAAAITEGLAADITDLVTKEWQDRYLTDNPQYRDLWKTGSWYNGRCYGILGPHIEPAAITYRTDWFRKAGIFNKEGEGGPPEDWTWKDFRDICKKLTNPKEKKFAIGLLTGGHVFANYCLITLYAVEHGWPMTCNDRLTPAWIMPDKTGKYVYRAGVIKPIIDALKFFNEMRWEDNSLLLEPNANPKTQFNAMRTAMYYKGEFAMVAINPISTPHKYSPTETTEDILRATLPPTAEYGLQPNIMFDAPILFDASLSKEELKAAFDWACWNTFGTGFINLKYRNAQQYKAGIKPAVGWLFYDAYAMPYKTGISSMFGEILDEVSAEYPTTRKVFKELFEKSASLPIIPYSSHYGLKVENSGEIQDVENSLRYSVMVKKNASRAEIEKMVEEAATKINRKMLNYKIENSIEKWREYFKVLDDFYKKNFPRFYGSKDYEENFVSYFKF